MAWYPNWKEICLCQDKLLMLTLALSDNHETFEGLLKAFPQYFSEIRRAAVPVVPKSLMIEIIRAKEIVSIRDSGYLCVTTSCEHMDMCKEMGIPYISFGDIYMGEMLELPEHLRTQLENLSTGYEEADQPDGVDEVDENIVWQCVEHLGRKFIVIHAHRDLPAPSKVWARVTLVPAEFIDLCR